MKTARFILFGLLIGLFLFGLGASTARGVGLAQEQPVLLRLKYATFDPLAGEPSMPSQLRLDAYPEGAPGAYIVQFKGPVQDAWKEEVAASGGKVLDYLPDYAFLVWMDSAARANVANLASVRWVGMYQPAYKLSPNLDKAKSIYRISLFPDVDTKAIEARLAQLKTPTTTITGENFLLILPDRNVEAVAAWPEVLWVEPYLFQELHNDVATGIMNGSPAWTSGLTGSGMTVTVADTGIDSGIDTGTAGDMHPDFDNRLAQISSWPVVSDGCGNCCWNSGANDGAQDKDSGHGTHVLGSVAGNGAASSGTIKGLAYQASLTFQAVEQYVDFTPFCESFGPPYVDTYSLMGLPDDLNTLFLEAYNWGSRIHSNSWGSDVAGEYTTNSRAVDQFVWSHPDMVILYSAGNSGTDGNPNVTGDEDGYVDNDSIGSPGTAKNNITSGASDNERSTGGLSAYIWQMFLSSLPPYNPLFPNNPTASDFVSDSRQEMAAFSSRGPTNDGRLKPDVVAPGTNILSTRSRYISGNGWGAYSNTNYMYDGGTSMSNPLIAGAATLVREYYVEQRGVASPSAALVKATLINSAVDITGYGNTSQEAGKPIPNNHEGWGLVNVGAATTGQRNFQNGVNISTGTTITYTYQISSTGSPFKVTLAWSDYPGSLPSGGLVNNLDLRVTAPDGTVYLGNQFTNGWSVTGGTADTLNNVESVFVQSAATGAWKVAVKGTNVPQGPQPFAFVVTGSFIPQNTYRIYQPVVRRMPPAGPQPGFWQSQDHAVEFYVTSDRANVDDFAIYVSVPACGNVYKITYTSPVSISSNQFAVSGAFQFNGTFDSQTAAHGNVQLNSFPIQGCGNVSLPSTPWTVSWINSNPPPPLFQEVLLLEKLNRVYLEARLEPNR